MRRGGTAIAVRCMWLNTPLAQAQVNLVARLIDLFGAVPDPEALRSLARAHEGVMAPTSQMRAVRELEPPSLDEGFAGLERAGLRSRRAPGRGGRRARRGTGSGTPGWETAIAAADPSAPHLVFDWTPDGGRGRLDAGVSRLQGAVTGVVDGAVCPHGAGPPRCWCRPPLPGLALAFTAGHDLDPARCVVVGAGPAHRTLANALGARHIPVVA